MDEIVHFQPDTWTGMSNASAEIFPYSRRHAASPHGMTIAYIETMSATA
ncbi:hypothetical protein [Paraburkholderia caffeinilytica]